MNDPEPVSARWRWVLMFVSGHPGWHASAASMVTDLEALAEQGLVRRGGGAWVGAWWVTDAGREALELGQFVRIS